ncbi:MAG: four helix bundle protein [Verrucomicrobiae bacterium]|nr:four helix bundle protein [Verrucomicrobiae bacterium]
MEGEETAFRAFEDLQAYRAAREFHKAVSAIAARLPRTKAFRFAAQIRRAALSLTNNIAEGYGRCHYLAQIKFSLQARGSLEEPKHDPNRCLDQGYLPPANMEGMKQGGFSHMHRLKAVTYGTCVSTKASWRSRRATLVKRAGLRAPAQILNLVQPGFNAVAF